MRNGLNNPPSFIDIFNKKIAPCIDQLNTFRKLLKLIKILTFTCFIAFFIFVGIGIYFKINIGPIILMLFILLLTSAFLLLVFKNYYSKQYKSLITSSLVKSIDSSLKYTYKKSLKNLLIDSNLFPEFDNASCSDVIEGTINKSQFTIINTKAYYETGPENERVNHNVFEGMFITINIKSVDLPNIQLIPKNQTNQINKWVNYVFQKQSYIKKSFYNLEDTYLIKGEDSYSHLYLDIEQYVLKLKEIGITPFLSIRKNMIYLAIPTKGSIFNIQIEKSITKDTIEKLWDEILFYLSVTVKLYSIALSK